MATYYVTQDGSGTKAEAVDSATPMSVTTHNGETFSAGDVIVLGGNITTSLIAPSSGSAGNLITYTAQQLGSATLQNSAAFTIQLQTRDYIKVANLIVINTSASDRSAIWVGGADNTTERHITISDCVIEAKSLTSNAAVQGRGRYITVEKSIIDCGNDCVHLQGRYATVNNCIMTAALASPNGDGVQIAAGGSGCNIKNNVITISAGSTKQGVLVSNDAEADPFEYQIIGNHISMVSSAASAGILCESTLPVVSRNFISINTNTGDGGLFGVFTAISGARVDSNIVIGGKTGFQGGNVTSQTWANNIAVGCSEYGFYLVFNQATLTIYNNIATECNVGLRRYEALPETGCCFFGNNENITNESGNSISAGSSSFLVDPQLDATYRPQNRTLWGTVPRLDTVRRDYDEHVREALTTPGAFAMERAAAKRSVRLKVKR